MPHVEIQASSGAVNLHYIISTPSKTSANAIDRTIPTVIFLHPMFFAQEIFHYQFSDPQLRRFNLIAVDARGHGDTTGEIGEYYDQVEAAEDVVKFMGALSLPPCHFFGVSMGSGTALQLAISHPDKVLSLFLVSLPWEKEPEDVAAGRKEICDFWTSGDGQGAISGAAEFGFSTKNVTWMNHSKESKFIKWLKARCLSQGEGKTSIKAFCAISAKFFDREPYSEHELARILYAIKLIYCSGDIAYENAEAIENLKIKINKVKKNEAFAELITIKDAGRFGNVTNSEQINALMFAFVTKQNIPPLPSVSTSPWYSWESSYEEGELIQLD